ncbi:MAG: hypothetical protein IKO74_06485 [Selenomonadaceae bacterium]|nr:hypothetical protein [Selenomonadaceae bacterium]
MKKFFVALFTVILFSTLASAEATPVRIARLPIIFQSTVPDEDTCSELETKIARAVHIPLNGTLQLAEYLPMKNSAQVFNDLWQEMHSQNKKAKLQDAMRPLAQKLDADIIVCPVLKDYGQVVMPTAWNETIMHSYARVELIVFDRRNDTLTYKKAAQSYNDSYHPHGTATQLAKICFDRVIDDSKLRQLIHDIRN